MKNILTVLFIMSLSAISAPQADQQFEPKSQKSVTHQQIVELPISKQSFRPKITLQRALKMAESYVEKERIDISSYHLYEAKYIMYGSKDNQEPCWFFWWVHENGAAGNYVEIIVSIETGNVRRLPSM